MTGATTLWGEARSPTHPGCGDPPQHCTALLEARLQAGSEWQDSDLGFTT